jgi:hypothetical protein
MTSSGSGRRARVLATASACFALGIGIGWWVGDRAGAREAGRLQREIEEIRRRTAAAEAGNDRKQAELVEQMERLGIR